MSDKEKKKGDVSFYTVCVKIKVTELLHAFGEKNHRHILRVPE